MNLENLKKQIVETFDKAKNMDVEIDISQLFFDGDDVEEKGEKIAKTLFNLFQNDGFETEIGEEHQHYYTFSLKKGNMPEKIRISVYYYFKTLDVW